MLRLQSVKSSNTGAFWIEQALSREVDAEDAEPFEGQLRTDVLIVGGGFTGLWTAIELKKRNPNLDVTLIEAKLCGTGASGRNGGHLMGWWERFHYLTEAFGVDEARWIATAAMQTVDEIGAFCAENDIDAGYRKHGRLHVATAERHIDIWQPWLDQIEQAGMHGIFEPLDPAEVAERCKSSRFLAGIFEPVSATVQPALLARGLRRVAIERGVRIFEQTPALSIERGSPITVRTPRGIIQAERVGLAIYAWAASIPSLRRSIQPAANEAIATAPDPERAGKIGGRGGEAITDERFLLNYLHATEEGRVVLGRATGTIAPGGTIPAWFTSKRKQADAATGGFRFLFPHLADLPITHRWGGPIDRTWNSLPLGGELEEVPGVRYFAGYSGLGVGPSLLGGRILASSLLECDDDYERSSLNQGVTLRYPREPRRYIGQTMLRLAMTERERAEEEDRAMRFPYAQVRTLTNTAKGKHD
jgi:glycine/D-amino acid oxidase-like deaminating enzyme